jgi:hypothetical protein
VAHPGEQTVIVAFPQPCTVEHVTMEVEKREFMRTQEVLLASSTDGGLTYRELVRQEFNLAPMGHLGTRELDDSSGRRHACEIGDQAR